METFLTTYVLPLKFYELKGEEWKVLRLKVRKVWNNSIR